MKAAKTKLTNPDFAKPIGKSSLLRIDWKSWDKEVPRHCEDIWVIIRLKKGYFPVTGTYFDQSFPAKEDMPSARFRSVRFTEFGIPETFMGSKDWKRLIAWGTHRGVVRLAKDCKKCKRLECVCAKRKIRN